MKVDIDAVNLIRYLSQLQTYFENEEFARISKDMPSPFTSARKNTDAAMRIVETAVNNPGNLSV